MKLITSFGLLAISLCSYAQQYSYPMNVPPKGVAMYGDVGYYFSDKTVYNLENNVLSNSDSIVDICIAPNGRTYTIITSSKKGDRHIQVFDLWKSNKRVANAGKLSYTPTLLCYVPNGHELIVADQEGKIRILNPLKLDFKQEFKLDESANEIKVSPDGYNFAAVHGSTVEIWDILNKIKKGELRLDGMVKDIAFSPTGSEIAVLSDNGKLTIFSSQNLQQQNQIDALGLASRISYHPDGKFASIITGDSRILIVNLLNPTDRSYIDSATAGIDYLNFVKTQPLGNVYLAYATPETLVYENMDYLAPLRSKLIADKLADKLAEWEKQLPNETLEEHKLRVNDATRLEQIKLFEQEIATEMALEELGLAQMDTGSYNLEEGMLAIDLGDKLNDIYLQVPPSEIDAFLNPGNLEFRNAKYGLNKLDEFELLYADVYNKETGKTYTYNNLQGQYIDFIVDEFAYNPLELVHQTSLEESSLEGLTADIINEARENNILSDHTHVSVAAKIVPNTLPDGKNVKNYEVSVSYTVDEEFSAKEDYPGGKYLLDESPAGKAMIDIVAKALKSDFAKYMHPGKKLVVEFTGTADATPIRRVIPYGGEYGSFIDKSILFDGDKSSVTVTSESGITDNKQLAFLRAVGVEKTLQQQVPQLSEMDTEYIYNISVSSESGSEYRKVGVKFTFVDAFAN